MPPKADTTVDPYPFTVFISHSHRDRAWVYDWLLPRLEAAGLEVLIDTRDFTIGAVALVNMERAVEASRHTLLVLTPHWVASEWTNFESLLMQTDDPTGLRGRFLPLMLETCEPPKRLGIFTYADFRDPAGREAALARLLRQITEDASPPWSRSADRPSQPYNYDTLSRLLQDNFSDDELRELCFFLEIDYIKLGGSNTRQRISALLALAEVKARVKDLVRIGTGQRPDLAWPSLVSETAEPTGKQIDRVALFQNLVKYFNEGELRTLCFDLGVDYDNLSGDGKADKARELITYYERHGQTRALVSRLRELRPSLLWTDVEPIPTPESLRVETLEIIAEAKLILVGDGNVGKTSLVKRLMYGSFDPNENTTPGIAVTRWFTHLPHTKVHRARLNIWDFGGQGSMHATHPYFFSQRAVYLVVLNVREDERVSRAEYWLRMVRTYGMESPVIIVANKIDQYPAILDERTLKDKYPNIVEFVRTSCLTGSGLSEFGAAIANAVCTLKDVAFRTPVSLVKLKRTLEGMTDPQAASIRDTLSLEEYGTLCDQCGVDPSQRDAFLRWLNDLGVMLYFGDDARLELDVVLNPFWVIEGIYQIINHEPLAQAAGKLKVAQIRAILPKERYPADKAMYILDMMRKFELCFALDEQQTLFLLPDLLPSQQPELPYFDRAGALKLQFEYPVWQGAILTRLLVRLNHYLVENAYWRNGALLQSLDRKNRALVVADEADRRLRIWVDGEPATRRNLLNRIREELNVIHGNQRDLVVKEWVITSQGGEVAYQLLVNLEAKGTETYDVLIGEDLVELNVKELLCGVRAEIMPDTYRLKQLIVTHLSLDELDDLCFKFKISLEDIEGENNKDSKARNLVRRFERTGRMPELMAVLRDLRRDTTWA